jgi:hypothetical protein
MKYMIFNSEDEAIAYSQAEAERRGCFGDVTKYWWSWIVHEDGRAALVGVDVANEVLSTAIIYKGEGEPPLPSKTNLTAYISESKEGVAKHHINWSGLKKIIIDEF